ncbi:MAG: Hsp20/alpha crystallin family protein [Candidatus Cloacimonadaceae bacterium]|nr:Hsp20/alpha crystallin family protein [Candidatus Cloacimonadaceae bacterium]MDP3114441.1 Hsp20/alpha crystallin family protein [Candidatus Cloacimonadaceae bacterium]
MHDKIFNNLIGIQREMLKILGEVSSLTNSPLAIEDAIDDFWHPKCDVFQTDTEFVIIVELAGVDKDEISIACTDEFLRISGTRCFPNLTCGTSYYSMEIETGRFERRVYFPDVKIDRESPKVQYINGILRISFAISPVLERIIPID